MDDLDKLIEAVAGGEKFVGQTALRAGLTEFQTSRAEDVTIRGDMNAALALKEALLPGWCVADLSQNGMLVGDPWGCILEDWNLAHREGRRKRRSSSGYDYDDPARALFLATLKGYRAKMEAGV